MLSEKLMVCVEVAVPSNRRTPVPEVEAKEPMASTGLALEPFTVV